MSTVNFNTRIESSLMSLFRRASESWASRQAPGLVNASKSNLTRWMISVLVPAAQKELSNPSIFQERSGDGR